MTKQICLIFAIVLFLALDGYADPSTQPARNQFNEGHLYEVSIGLLAHDVDNLWSRSKKESGVDVNAEMIFKRPRRDVLHGRIRPNLGISVNNQGGTSKIYGGILWELASKSLFFNIGIGVALHDGELEAKKDDKKGFGARVLFRIPIETGLTIHGRHRFSILFEHISNGYLAHPNEGLDSLGLRYSVLFN
ncbi:MAG: acyloxyacyl hydrolase [Deltaproteobacteria bacterium]|nr:acyloxyacyl hydrolase [Deltaproteobacteria bacterium]